MNHPKLGNEYRTTMVYITDYQNRIPSGYLQNPIRPEPESFRGLMDFFRKMEVLLDELQLPQSFTRPRSFQPGEALSGPSGHACGDRIPDDALAAFSLRVLYRQHSAWQGAITWLEGGRREQFRSALELAFLMDSTLERRMER